MIESYLGINRLKDLMERVKKDHEVGRNINEKVIMESIV